MDNTNDINKTNNEKVTENNENIAENIVNKESNEIKPKSNFVPSYKKNKESMEDTKKQKNDKGNKVKKERKVKSKITVIVIIIIILAILLLLGSFVIKVKNNNETTSFERLMNDYDLANLYNNQSASSMEKVEKSEAIKVIIGSILNTDDITKYMPDSLLYEKSEESSSNMSFDEIFNTNKTKIEETYSNEYWIMYAESIGFLNQNEINSKNYNDKVTYKEIINYISKAKTLMLNKNLDINVAPNFKDYEKYDSQTKWAIADLVYNGIIQDKKANLNANRTAKKDDLNEIITNFIYTYNLLTIGNEKININEEKMPSNKDEYIYTLANINKKVYEIENYKANDNYKNARETYKEIKDYYEALNILVERYYNQVLNIDYETISVESIKTLVISNVLYTVTDEQINEYVEYVKQNKIKVTGSAKVQNPIIYFDGNSYRVRTKLEYNIESADNLENIFLLDKEAKYKLGKNEIYVDVPVTSNEARNMYTLKPVEITSIIAGSVKE